MGDSGRDERLREAAANRGLKLVKSRIRTPGKGDYGRYGLTDAGGAKLLGFGKSGLTATVEEIEDYLHKGALADWKTSLKAAGAKPPKGGKKRSAAEPPSRRSGAPEREAELDPEPEPEPEPEPPPLAVRPARPSDCEAIAGLVSGLGYDSGTDDIAKRLTALRKAGEMPLVAEQGAVIGVLTWHVTPVLHRPRPVGRITMMVVAKGERRRGVGRALVEAACARLREKGCGLIEVTSNVDLSGAHSFYRKLGFERTSYRFAKSL
jgi:ribosomal protein S18 acetylase RimI-like enzyme